MRPKAILTFDLEFYYNSQFLKAYISSLAEKNQDYLLESTIPILSLLDQYNHHATFFVLGKAAEKYPEVIKKISEAGHEVASHGYSHKVLDELTPQEFEQEIIRTNQIIQGIIQKQPIGFRAPAFSLNKNTQWSIPILQKHNFKYDASLHPFMPKKLNLPFIRIKTGLGGIYFRILPLPLYITLTKVMPQKAIYLHPNELFTFMPQIQAPWLKRKIKYIGTKNAFDKFKRLCQYFQFQSIEQYLYENNHPAQR